MVDGFCSNFQGSMFNGSLGFSNFYVLRKQNSNHLYPSSSALDFFIIHVNKPHADQYTDPLAVIRLLISVSSRADHTM